MIRTTIVTRGKGFKPLQATIEKYPQRFNAVASAIFRQEQPELLQALKEPGAKPTYPIRWDSDRQRKFVMAKLRREGNLPYKRTNRMVNSAVVRLVNRNGALIVESGYNSEVAQYVVGSLFRPGGRGTQSRVHQGRWKLAEPKVERWRTRYLKRVIDVLPSVFEATGAV